jgi:hypothetical protein
MASLPNCWFKQKQFWETKPDPRLSYSGPRSAGLLVLTEF